MMWRAFLRIFFGRQDPGAALAPSPAPPPPLDWRQPPIKTLTDDLGHGLVLTTTYPTGHHGFVAAVGEAHYQEALRALAGELGTGGVFRALLVPESQNPHDAHAVAVCLEGDGGTVAYLGRAVAKTYHPLLARQPHPVSCPARLTGGGHLAIGVVLDFEPVRDALGLPRVSVDLGDIDDDAVNQYHRLNKANRLFVKETRPLEQSDPAEAISRYRRALTTLVECRDLARAKGLEAYGFALNQTDAIPIDRLVRCLVGMGQAKEAVKELDCFIEAFSHARDTTLVKAAMARIDRAAGGRQG